MPTITRDDYQVIYHHDHETDAPLLVARYSVEGLGRRLMVSMWMPSNMDKGDTDMIAKALLDFCDEEAQWCAENPEQVEDYRLIPCCD